MGNKHTIALIVGPIKAPDQESLPPTSDQNVV